MNNQMKGYLLGAAAAASYGTNPLFSLPLMQAGIDANSVLFIRYLFAIPILALIMLVRRQGFGLRRGQVLPLVILGLTMALSSMALYVSYLYLGSAIASTLLFIYPILVTVIMVLCFHERVKMLTVLCIVLAMSGIALLYRGDGGEVLSPVGLLLVFLSALSYAVYLVAVNGRRLRGIPTLKLTLYIIFFGLFLFSFRFQPQTISVLNAHPTLWIHAFCMALMPTAVSLLCTGAAISKIGSTPVAIMGALEPVTAVAFAVTVFHETMTMRLALGMLLVIIAVTLIIAGDSINFRPTLVRRILPDRRRHRSS